MLNNFNDRPFHNLTALIPTTASDIFMPHKQQHQSIADVLGLSGKRVYYCQRCLNHGVLAPRKNHKCECIYAQCNCAKCILVERRRVLNTQLHELEENEQHNQNQLDHYAFYQSHNEDINEKRHKLPFINFNLQNSVLYSNNQELTNKITKPEIKKQSKNLQEILFDDSETNTLSSTALTTKTTTTTTTTPKKTTEMTKQLLFCNQLHSGGKNYQNNFEENCYKIKPDYLEINVEDHDVLLKNNYFDNKILAEQSDEPKEFRSRISTSNSIHSNATTNSSGTSGSSNTGFSFFSDIGDNNIVENGNFSAFKRISLPASIRIKGERVPNCQKCGQHGRKSRLKGHKRFCPFKNCECPKCQVITERQKLMADQIKIRRRQCKDTLMKLKSEKIVSVAAAVENFHSNSNTFNAVTNELIQQNNYKNNQQQTIQQQLLPSLLLPANNLNEEANQQQISYLNTLNLLCKQFITTPMLVNPLTSISSNSSNLIENNSNSSTINTSNYIPFVSSTLTTTPVTNITINTKTKPNVTAIIDLLNKTPCSTETVSTSSPLLTNIDSNNFNTILKNETINNIKCDNKEYFKSIINDKDKPQIMSQASNLEIWSSQLNLTSLSLFSTMLLKEFETNNKPLTSILFNGLSKNKENNEKNHSITNPLSGYLDEATLNKMKILFLNQSNSILPKPSTSSSVIEAATTLAATTSI